jgi:GAF domain-containing protein
MATKLIYKMLVTLLSWIVLHARSANTKEIESPIPAVGALLFGVTVLGLGSVACWSRLAIGSIWPSVLMHATWNSMIQDGFDALTAGEGPRSVEGGGVRHPGRRGERCVRPGGPCRDAPLVCGLRGVRSVAIPQRLSIEHRSPRRPPRARRWAFHRVRRCGNIAGVARWWPALMERTRSPARPRPGVPGAELAVLVREQAALRRVATLVAREASPTEVFGVVAREVAGSLDIPMISVVKYGTGGSATQVGAWGAANPFPVGLSWTLDGTGVAALVAETARPARVSDYAEVPGGIAAVLAREAGIRSAVGVPIVVGGAVWGVMLAMWTRVGAPAGVEERLAAFTGLVATAIANAQARDDLHRLVDEQSALRRVATAVAGAAGPEQVFDLVCRETGRLFGADTVNLVHFTPDGVNLTMGRRRGGALPVPGRPLCVGSCRRPGRRGRLPAQGPGG